MGVVAACKNLVKKGRRAESGRKKCRCRELEERTPGGLLEKKRKNKKDHVSEISKGGEKRVPSKRNDQ